MWIAASLLLAAAVGRRDTVPALAARDAAPCAPGSGAPAGAVFVTVTETEASDSARAAAGFCAWAMDLRLTSSAPGTRAAAPRSAAAELRITRAVESGTAAGAASMSRARVAGRRLPVVVVEVPAGVGPALRVQLAGVTVVGQRIVGAAGGDDLEALVASQAADVVQLEADRNDAARHLTELRALDQRKLAAGFEVARADDRVRVLDAKLAAARGQLARSRAHAAHAAGATEELTLSAERAEVLDATPDR